MSGFASLPRYKDFPPGWTHLQIPVSSRSAALAGLALYAPCRRGAIFAQRAARVGVRLFGPRVLPGVARPWEANVPTEVWQDLLSRWQHEIGAFDEVAGYRRTQERPGTALLLLRRGVPLAFLKVRPGHGSLHKEFGMLQAIWQSRPRSFVVPQPLTTGELLDWQYLAMSALPPVLHAPPRSPPLARILAEIELAFAAHTHPPDVPDSWSVMHGDFTPWNLRQVGSRLYLVDWEDVNWGPPSADMVLYRAVETGLGWHEPWRGAPADAIEFWTGRIAARPARDARELRLRDGLLQALAAMRRNGTA